MSSNPAFASASKPMPFAFEAPKDIYQKTSGPCDVDGEFMRTQLQEYRYAVQLWTVTVAAPGADGVIVAGTERRSFAEGVGDAGTNLGWGTPVLSQAQTNLYPNGSLNNAKNGAFVARSIGFSILRPFTYNATTGERIFNDVVDAYAPRIARGLAEALEFSMLQRDNNVSLNIGLIQHWPGAQQIVEAGYPTVDKANGASIILPLRKEYVFIDDNQGSQNFLVGRANTQLTFTSDPADPIVAGFSVPIMTTVYGDVMSVEAACNTLGGRSMADEAARLISQGLTPAQAYDLLKGR